MSKRHGFAPRERVRLWLSYQRYALLLSSGCIGLVAGVVALGSAWTWGWAALVVAVPASISVGRFSTEVFLAHPRKLRATWAHQRRIDAARFTPTDLRNYCSDPCWRVVADEVLQRAGVPAAERRELIRQFEADLEDEANVAVFIDHRTGVVRRVSAKGETFTFLPQHQQQRSPSVLEPGAPSPHFEPGPTS